MRNLHTLPLSIALIAGVILCNGIAAPADGRIVVSSNDEVEYGFCTDVINMNDYKLK